jgi:hypothetical protein
MRILSIRQPYAWAIVAGIKTVENRRRPFSYRGPMLIHAGQKLAATPLRAIEERFGLSIPQDKLRFGGIVGAVDLVDCVTEHSSPWFEGPFGLVLRNPRPLLFIHLSGRLSFFQEPDALSPAVAAALRSAPPLQRVT